jgi:deoxyribodipyrimidine photo-lyase
VITWREVGLNACVHLPRTYDTFDAVPAWAQQTLARHAKDPREATYDRAALEAANTGDRLWNAAQRQLLREGRIHNHLRMLWGKKVLEWTPRAQDAFETLVALNDRYAVDGRDANSYSGISWVFGRYDRPWPERPVFGTVRCMTSGSAMKKLHVREYLERYGP